MKATTQGALHNFTGTIRSASTFFSVNKLNQGSSDSVRLNGKLNKISFTFDTGGVRKGFLIPGKGETLPHEWPDTASGLSFVVTDGSAVKFTLYVDGMCIGPEDIYIGRGSRHPQGGVYEKPVEGLGTRNKQ
jgi:hypothetical protein